MSRKDALRSALSGAQAYKLPADNLRESAAVDAPTASHPQRVRSGAVGAMGRSLGTLIRDAERVRTSVASGEAVVEIQPEKLESSFVEDRIGQAKTDHVALVDSIREHGQQVPILARPHPEKLGQFQIAYGHRRVRALAELKRPVRAIVIPLSDEQLVVAQGQENSARSDLSYIERARFAVVLEEKGFNRSIIMSALSMEKTQLSRLLSLGRSIPPDVAVAVGAAPKAGRPRWAALAERLETESSRLIAADLFADPAFAAMGTDARFLCLFEALSPKKPVSRPRTLAVKDEGGRRVAVIERNGARLMIVVDGEQVPEFGDYLAEKLPGLYRAFCSQKQEVPAEN